MPQLRVRATCEALRRLAAAGRIDPATAAALIEDYRFLRRVEHRLQMVDDAQTHRLPADRDGITRLALFLGYPGSGRLRRRSDRASGLGRAPLRRAVRAGAEPFRPGQPGLYRRRGRSRDLDAPCRGLGFADPPAVGALVRSWHHGRMRATRSQRVREILTELVPELLRIFGATPASRRGAAALRPVPVASAGRGAAVLAVPGESGIARLGRRGHGRGAAARGAAGAAAGIARRGVDPGVFRAAAGSCRARRRSRRVARSALANSPTRWICFAAGPASGASRSGCSCCAARSMARPPARRLADIAETRARRARSGGRGGVRAAARAGTGRRIGGDRDGASRQPRDDPRLRSRPDPDLRRPARRRGLRWPPAAPGVRLLRPAQPTADWCDHRADGRGFALPGRHAAAAFGLPPGRSLRAWKASIATSVESAWTWEHMALTRARPVAGDPALSRRVGETIEAVLRSPRDPRRLVADVADMRAAHRRRKSAALALGPQKPARRPDRPRIHRSVSDPARGRFVAAAAPPRHR